MAHTDPPSALSETVPSDTAPGEHERTIQRLRDLFREHSETLGQTRDPRGWLNELTEPRKVDEAHLIRLGFADDVAGRRCPVIKILDALTAKCLVDIRYERAHDLAGCWSGIFTSYGLKQEYAGPFPLECRYEPYDEEGLVRVFAAELDRFAGLPAARTELERFHARVLHEFERAGIALTPNTPGDSLRGFCSPPRSLGDGWEASFYVSKDFAGENAAIQFDVSKEGAYGGLALLLVPQLMEDGTIGFDYEVSADGYRGLRPHVSIVCETEADGVGLIRTCAQLYLEKAEPIAAPAP